VGESANALRKPAAESPSRAPNGVASSELSLPVEIGGIYLELRPGPVPTALLGDRFACATDTRLQKRTPETSLFPPRTGRNAAG
jgi:hypothetical protein